MTYLEEWLSSIDSHLASVTPEKLEENYLRVRDGYGLTIKEYLTCNLAPEYMFKSYDLSNKETKFVSQERILAKFDKVPSVKSMFQSADNDETYDVAA